MPRYDLHRLRDGELVVDVQSDFVSRTAGRVVVPLLPRADMPQPTPRLHPVVVFEGADYIVATHLISAVPAHVMGPPLGSLRGEGERLTRALDTLLSDW